MRAGVQEEGVISQSAISSLKVLVVNLSVILPDLHQFTCQPGAQNMEVKGHKHISVSSSLCIEAYQSFLIKRH